MEKKISLIIPTCGKRMALIKKSLMRIKELNPKPSEIIIVDNSSKSEQKIFYSDLSNKLHLPIKVFFEKRKGSTYARNLGIKMASYNNLFFIDDDCIVNKNWLKEGIKELKKNHLVMGISKNIPRYSFFSLIENLQTRFFMNLGIVNKKKGLTIFFDSKNFAVKKSFIFKYKLYFNNQFSRFSIFEDIDYGLRSILKTKKLIKISKKMVVYHFGRDNLFSHLKREFNKGEAFSFFLNYRLPQILNLFNKNPKIKFYLFKIFLFDNKFKKMISYSIKKINKNIIIILIFFLLIDFFINLIGFYYFLLKNKINSFIINLSNKR